MAKGTKKTSKPDEKERKLPQEDQEDRENTMISLAVDLAEQKLRDGTASSQLICHYLKLGSTKERLDKMLLQQQIEFTKAKTQNLNNPSGETAMYEAAIAAMKKYGAS